MAVEFACKRMRFCAGGSGPSHGVNTAAATNSGGHDERQDDIGPGHSYHHRLHDQSVTKTKEQQKKRLVVSTDSSEGVPAIGYCNIVRIGRRGSCNLEAKRALCSSNGRCLGLNAPSHQRSREPTQTQSPRSSP